MKIFEIAVFMGVSMKEKFREEYDRWEEEMENKNVSRTLRQSENSPECHVRPLPRLGSSLLYLDDVRDCSYYDVLRYLANVT